MNRRVEENKRIPPPVPAKSRTIVKRSIIRAGSSEDQALPIRARSNSRPNSRGDDPSSEMLQKEIERYKRKELEYKDMVITLRDTISSQSRIMDV
jgi:hypothetical protein